MLYKPTVRKGRKKPHNSFTLGCFVAFFNRSRENRTDRADQHAYARFWKGDYIPRGPGVTPPESRVAPLRCGGAEHPKKSFQN